MYQYSFEAPNDGFACGEQSLRENFYDEDLKMSDCFKNDVDAESATRINTLMYAGRKQMVAQDFGLSENFNHCNLFFKPNLKFCKWLKEYANGRMIIDVGSGQGHLVNMLKMQKALVMGLEPYFNIQIAIEHRSARGLEFNINEILPMTVQEAKNIINGLGAKKAMLVFARPCHSTFVFEGMYNMPEGMEALYITVPENLKLYDDLGLFKKKAKLIEHEGTSEDNEVVYSVIK